MTLTHARILSFLARFFAPELRAWRGRAALPQVFWGYGVATSLAIAATHAAAVYLERLALQQALIVVSGAYTAFILVAIWRCAENATPFWGTLARWLTVAWALNAAHVLFFLQIELALRHVR
jgi:hypothetical protein